MIKKVLLKIEKYLERVVALQQKGVAIQTTFDKGYYDSNNSQLKKFEGYFLLHVPKIKKEIIDEIRSSRNQAETANLLHLLGWAKEYKEIPNFILDYIDHQNSMVGNAAMRALFPMIVSGKYNAPLKKITPLIYERSKYTKNKALGILAFYPKEIKEKIDLAYIKKLAKHKEMMVREPAKLLLRKIDSQ